MLLKRLMLLVFLGMAGNVAAINSWIDTVRYEIDSVMAHHFVMEQASCGILVYDATADTIVYSHDAKKAHRPASTTKTFTCAAVLKYLTSDHPIKTTIYHTGKIKKKRIDGQKRRILMGDIFVKGNFDPAFNSADMDTLLMIIEARKIDSIAGNLYADLSMKNRVLGGNGWSWDDTGDDFPLLSPLLLDKDTTFMTTLYQRLNESGIHVAGSIKDSICPEEKEILAEKCRTVEELMPQCLKESDNRYAESFLYQLGTLSNEKFPDTEVSIKYVEELIDSLGFKKGPYRFVDGSGLSPYNYVTPEIEVALLKYIYKESDFYDTFRSALPIGGVDGTLKNRMKGTAAEGKVFAKTGSLTGTYALAGYTENKQGHVLIFSILHDGVTYGHGNDARGMQDQILNILCK